MGVQGGIFVAPPQSRASRRPSVAWEQAPGFAASEFRMLALGHFDHFGALRLRRLRVQDFSMAGLEVRLHVCAVCETLPAEHIGHTRH